VVRRAAGLSLDVLAARTNFSKSYLGNVEAGRRRVTAEIAAAHDLAVGTGGMLSRMLAGEPDRLVGRTAEVARLGLRGAASSFGVTAPVLSEWCVRWALRRSSRPGIRWPAGGATWFVAVAAPGWVTEDPFRGVAVKAAAIGKGMAGW